MYLTVEAKGDDHPRAWGKLLGIHITDNLSWTVNTTQLLKKAQEQLDFLKRRSILPGLPWSTNTCSVVKLAERITRTPLPSLQRTRVHRRAASIREDPTHPHTDSSQCRTSTFKNFFFPNATRLLRTERSFTNVDVHFTVGSFGCLLFVIKCFSFSAGQSLLAATPRDTLNPWMKDISHLLAWTWRRQKPLRFQTLIWADLDQIVRWFLTGGELA